MPKLSKSSHNSLQAGPKCQNIHIKTQFESLKHVHETTFVTLKYLQKTHLETTYLGYNVINLFKKKVAQNVNISLGYFIFQK
jgi:hypothetical protein